MNELNADDKALVVNALLRLVGEDVLTPLEKRDILHEITGILTGFNVADIVTETNNKRRLLLKTAPSGQEYIGMARELVFNPTDKTIKIFGETGADDTIIGAIPDIDIEALLANIDYVTSSATGLSGTNYINGWYRKYKSGWVEQGGIYNKTTSTGNTFVDTNISLPVTMADLNYFGLLNGWRHNDPAYGTTCRLNPSTTSVVILQCYNIYGSSSQYINWEIKGFMAT